MRFGPTAARTFALASILALAPATLAQVRIYGGLSNFDVYNETGDDCNEFEIEFEGCHPEDVRHTYRNPNYGSPRIESLPSGTGIRVVYSRPNHATRPHAMEHFGVSLTGNSTSHRFAWKNGGIEPPTPPANPPLPLLTMEVTMLDGREVVLETVTNIDGLHRPIWIQRSATRAGREVSLEELMSDNPLITGSTLLDTSAEKIEFGEPMLHDESVQDFFEKGSQVISYKVWMDKTRWSGGILIHEPGTLLGHVMNASLTQRPGCETNIPEFTSQPEDASGWLGEAANLYVTATSNPDFGDLVYQWKHEGVDIPNQDNPRLEIDPITNDSAGSYTCVISNDCGFAMSASAHLTVVVCTADYTKDNTVDFFDYLDFVSDLEEQNFHADINGDSVLDFFDYLDFAAAFAAGC
jgi:hypothetical protein